MDTLGSVLRIFAGDSEVLAIALGGVALRDWLSERLTNENDGTFSETENPFPLFGGVGANWFVRGISSLAGRKVGFGKFIVEGFSSSCCGGRGTSGGLSIDGALVASSWLFGFSWVESGRVVDEVDFRNPKRGGLTFLW
jgi:hypothetical protein